MSASGILRSDEVIFYHPLDDFEEHTQSQVWTGTSAFTAGKIGQAESAISADTPTFGSGVTVDIPQFGAPLQTNHSLRRIDDSRLLLSYVDSTTGPDNYDPVVRVVTVSGTSGTFGTPQTLEASWGNTKHDCPILTMMNESSGIAWYWTDGFRAAARVVQTSGATITLGDQYNNETEYCYVPLDIEAVDSDKAIAAWEYNGDYFVGVVSMSGTTLTYGSSLNVQGAGSGTAWIRLTQLDTNTAAMVRYNGGNMYGTILTQSGTTVTAGPTTIITSGNVTVHINAREAVGLTSDKFVAFCQKNSLHPGYTGPFATVCGVSGTDITVGSTIRFDTSGSALIATSKLSSDSIFVDRSPSNVRILTVSGTSGSFGGVGTHPLTRIAPGLAVETLTSNTVVVVHSEQTGSPWPIEMAVGIIDLAASMTASSGGAYPSTSGNDRIVMAAWVKNITPGSSTATIERGYKIDVTATSISLGGTTAVWNDADILSLMSATGLNDGSSHLFVMNFENTSGNNWNLKTSVDGVSWVDQGAQNSGTQVIVTIDTLPNVSIEDGESGQWIDELVLWAGDKATFGEFTSQELTNLYNLADMYDKPMNEYEEGPFFLSSSIDLYVFSITNESVDLYLQAPSFINASSNLFLQADASHSASGDLFIAAYDNITASKDLFIDGGAFVSGTVPLFVFAPPPNLYDLITLYATSFDVAVASGNLYINGRINVEVSGDLYTFGSNTVTSSGNLYIYGIDQRAIYWADSSSNKIQRSLRDGSNIEDIIDTDLFLIQSLVINSATDQIYFGDSITDKIELSDSNGINREDIITSGLQGIRGITISDSLQKIYWTDTELNVIKRCNLDGSSVETIVSLGAASILQKISTHDGEGKIYWTDEELGSPTIKRANLDGTNIQTIMSTGLNQPREISVDTINNKIYWVDAINDSVDRMDLDGSNRINLATINGPQAIAIDMFGQKLYVGNLIGKIYSLELDGSNKTEIVDTSGVIRAIDFGFADYIPAIIDDISLFIDGYDITLASGDLFINGYEHIAASGDLFIDGYNTTFESMSLFTFAPPPDIYNTTILYIAGETESLAKPIDWLLKSSDHNPQIIGTIDGATSVNIQLWEITNGQNAVVTVASSGCYQIGNTGRWAWSTSDLPTYTTRQRQYFYLMTANNNETFAGQFFLELPESAMWIHPNDRNEYLI